MKSTLGGYHEYTGGYQSMRERTSTAELTTVVKTAVFILLNLFNLLQTWKIVSLDWAQGLP